MDNKLFLIDAYALIYRSYYAFINNPRYNSKGLNTSAIFGFTNTLDEVLQKENPDYIAVAFDTHAPTFRSEIFKEYKANRQETPEDIIKSEPYIRKILEGFKIPAFQLDGFEADDVIGTIAKKASQQNFEVFIMTSDKDYLQLIDENIKIYKPKGRKNDTEIIDLQRFREIYQLQEPAQYIDVLALAGDTADNIPGVPGIGEKTALKLIRQFGSLDGIYENINKLKGKQKEKLIQFKDQAYLSKKLVTIKTDLDLDIDFSKLKREKIDKDLLSKVFSELEFKTTAQRILNRTQETTLFDTKNKTEKTSQTLKTYRDFQVNYKMLKTDEEIINFVDNALKLNEIAFDTETSGLNPHFSGLVGISFATKQNHAVYIPIPDNSTKAKEKLQLLKPLLENKDIKKIGQNIKFDITILRYYGIEVKGELFDTMIAHYLLYPELPHNLDYLAETYLLYKTIHIDELIGKKGKHQKSMRQLNPEQIVIYACEDADIALQLKPILETELKIQELDKLFYEVEMPLVKVLTEMEIAGVRLDTEFLENYRKEIVNKILDLEKEIYKLAGTEFNISSTKQLGEILFEKLKITDKPKLTKTKQYSTSEEELLKLKDKHPIVGLILQYRSLKKLINTYIDALPKMINPKTNKIHTSFNQTITATGRLSSNNPNLQNIPIRTPEGKKIRQAFIPSEGNIFIDADYSQIELRLMAHFSEDPTMLEAFRENKDIHRETAAKLFNVPIDQVTEEMRYKAKTANFAMIYGSTAYGLSRNLDISLSEAKKLLENYFQTYPKIKEFINKKIAEAREKEYVETILGRKRFLKDINSRNATVRSNAERNAINTPIQGSAADIIKLAMVKISEIFRQKNLKTKMILQVHDELLFDVPENEKDIVKQIVKDTMENVVKLKVPLIVDISEGKNWAEAH